MSTEFRSRYREEDQKEYDPRETIGGTRINGYHKAMLERMGTDPDYAVDTPDKKTIAVELAHNMRHEARVLNGDGKSSLEPREKQELDFRLQLLTEQYSAGKYAPDHPNTIIWERNQWKSALTLMEKANPDYGEKWVTGIREKLSDGSRIASDGISYDLAAFKADYKNQAIGNSAVTEYQREAIEALVNPGVEANAPLIHSHLRDLAFNMRGEARQAAWENPGTLTVGEEVELDQRLLNLYRKNEFSESGDTSWESRLQEADDWKRVMEIMEKIHPEYGWAIRAQEDLESARETNLLQGLTRNMGQMLTGLRDTLTGREIPGGGGAPAGGGAPGGAGIPGGGSRHRGSGEFYSSDPEDFNLGNTAITSDDSITFQAMIDGDYNGPGIADPALHRESLKHLVHSLQEGVAERNMNGPAADTMGLETSLEALSQFYRSQPGASEEGREYEAQLWTETLDQAAETLPGYDDNRVKDLANELWETHEQLKYERHNEPVGDTAIDINSIAALTSIIDPEYDLSSFNPEGLRDSLENLTHSLQQEVAEKKEDGAAAHTLGLETQLEAMSEFYQNNPGDSGERREREAQLWALTLDQAADTMPEYQLPWVRELADELRITHEKLRQDQENQQ